MCQRLINSRICITLLCEDINTTEQDALFLCPILRKVTVSGQRIVKILASCKQALLWVDGLCFSNYAVGRPDINNACPAIEHDHENFQLG